MTDAVTALTDAGVSIWLDDLSRNRLTGDGLAEMAAHQHVVGATTNPSIFAKAISSGDAYDAQLRGLAARGMHAGEALRRLHHHRAPRVKHPYDLSRERARVDPGDVADTTPWKEPEMDEPRPDLRGSDRSGVSALPASTLAGEHALLLREVSARADVLLGEAAEGRWPAQQLRALVDYLHLEVLQQVVDEEWLLFCSAYHAPDELARLRREHLELRLAIDVLAQAAAGGTALSPQQLAATTRDLLARLEEHLAAEEEVLAVAGQAPRGTTSLGGRPHEWYPLTEGPVIDIDALPSGPGLDAVLDRLLRMKPGEKLELRAGVDPGPIWHRLARADPGGYGIDLLQHGPPQWRIEVTRRPTG